MAYAQTMQTTVTTKNMITIPKPLAKKLGIKPGWKLDWTEGPSPDEILVRVIPDRAELGRRLRGRGRQWSPERDSVAELIAERQAEG